MSLMSLLNQDYSTSSSTSPQVAQAMQVLTKAQEKANATTTSAAGQSTVSITIDAKRAAAAKEDAGKDATVLATDLRKSFDAQYKKAGKKNSADLTALSGRALSVVALNEGGQFSKGEIAAAKQELRARDRNSALAMLASGPLTSTSLKSYTTNLLAARDTMSAEERQLRANDPSLR